LILTKLILVKSELNVNWFMFGCTDINVILINSCCLDGMIWIKI